MMILILMDCIFFIEEKQKADTFITSSLLCVALPILLCGVLIDSWSLCDVPK